MADDRTKPPAQQESWQGKRFVPIEDESRRTSARPPRRDSAMPPRLPPHDPTPTPEPAPTTAELVVHAPISSLPPPNPLDHHAFREFLDPRLVLLSEHAGPRAAAFRLLRDGLVAKKAPRIIVVTSPGVGEGKTTCAVNLALALRERPARKVLLLDGNFFVPALATIFRIDLTTRPAERMDEPWLLPYRIAEIVDGFHVGALLTAPDEPAPVFNSRWFDRVLHHVVKLGYEHVVIDAPSLDGSAAVSQMVSTNGGTLLTARAGKTTSRALRRAAGMIPEGQALGVTLLEGD